jgi:hypothetical protein
MKTLNTKLPLRQNSFYAPKVALLVCLLAFLNASWFWAKPARKEKNPISFHQQLASLLTYPPFMENDRTRLVVIQFCLNEEKCICGVEVFSPDSRLNSHIIRELTGQKISATKSK